MAFVYFSSKGYYNACDGDRLMIVDQLLAFMFGTLMFLLDFFPSGDFVKLPDGLQNMFKGVGRWVDMETVGTVVSLIIAVYAAYGTSMLLNWVIKRVRGG